MKVLFRFKPYDVDKPGSKAWVGFAEGDTLDDVMYVIDEFGDPTSADVIVLPLTHPMGFCIPYVYTDEYSPDEHYWCTTDEGQREISDWFFEYPVDDPRWETERAVWEDFLRTRIAH